MSNKNKKVLMISHHFPPTNSIAAVRIGKFAKYLPESGWTPVVLTTDTPIIGYTNTLPLEISEENVIRVPDSSINRKFTLRLLGINNNLPKDANIINKKNSSGINRITSNFINSVKPKQTIPFLYRLMYEPMGWYRYAVRAGLEAIKNNNISLIFSSFGPTVDHIIASRLHKETGIPWIAEFRDPWCSVKQPKIFDIFDKLWEKRTTKSAELIVSISPTLVEQLESFHKKKAVLITNGFDDSDYEGNIPPLRKFTITYTGNIYAGLRDPSPVFQALAELKNKKLISPGSIEIRFLGGNIETHIPYFAQKWDVEDYVKTSGSVSFKESIKKQMESTVLLSLEWNNPKGAGVYSGKIFEYLGAQRPVLSLGFKGGDLDKLLQETGCGIMTNDVSEIESILLKWLEEFKTTGEISYCFNPNKAVIVKHTRREQSKQLSKLFDEVLSGAE